MKFCPQCGTQAEDNISFCPKCGSQIPAYYPNPVQKKKHSALGIVAFILSLTISSLAGVVCAIIDLVIHKQNKKGLSIAAIVIGGIKMIIAVFLAIIMLIVAGKYTYDALCNCDGTDDYPSYDYRSEQPMPYDEYDEYDDIFGDGFDDKYFDDFFNDDIFGDNNNFGY